MRLASQDKPVNTDQRKKETAWGELSETQKQAMRDLRDSIGGQTRLPWSTVARFASAREAARHRFDDGRTLLMHAAKEGDWDALRALAPESSLDAQDKLGRSAFHWAAIDYAQHWAAASRAQGQQSDDILSYLAQKSDWTLKDRLGRTAVANLASKGALFKAPEILKFANQVARGEGALQKARNSMEQMREVLGNAFAECGAGDWGGLAAICEWASAEQAAVLAGKIRASDLSSLGDPKAPLPIQKLFATIERGLLNRIASSAAKDSLRQPGEEARSESAFSEESEAIPIRNSLAPKRL